MNEAHRDPARVHALARELHAATTRPWTLMEVCGGQTHALLRFGVDQLLPPQIELLHGPGCPVCVTPAQALDDAIALSRRPDVTLCTFADMLRVPATQGDLLLARAQGGDVRIVGSPLDALALAASQPTRQVVFLAVGFETTAPITALAVQRAAQAGVANFSLLLSHVRVPPALDALCRAPGCRVQGFLAAGHVCTIMGVDEYASICQQHRVPVVVTGFEPVDLLTGILACVRQLERGQAQVENCYSRAAAATGNLTARALMEQIFEPCDQVWRGLGSLPASGLRLRPAYRHFDAALRFPPASPSPLCASATDGSACPSGLVLQGRLRPPDCPHFGRDCTPDHPLGATMVSSEGACAAYARYGRTTPKFDAPSIRNPAPHGSP